MTKNLVSLENVALHSQKGCLLSDINMKICPGDRLNLLGSSGSGKTLLAKLIAGQLKPSEGQIIYDITMEDIAFAGDGAISGSERLSYYEQRYEVFIQEGRQTIKDQLSKLPYFKTIHDILHEFDLDRLLVKQSYQLSNGEQKLLKIILSISSKPGLLILDQPYLGVDQANRKKLDNLLLSLPVDLGILVVGKMPDTGLLNVFQKRFLEKGKLVDDYTTPNSSIMQKTGKKTLSAFNSESPFNYLVKMENVTVSYGSVAVLNNINFSLKPGERCVIKGPNGSGKSMLISLITGDNPKAYGQNIVLFDRLRGSGESIWDIKSKIGYLSPELHQHFFRGESNVQKILFGKVQVLENRFTSKLTCKEIVASGLTDRIGLETAVKDEKWLLELFDFFDFNDYLNKTFASLAHGTQRLVLLMRAIIKKPQLLILDEPCQGLDEDQILQFKNAINVLCAHAPIAVIYVSHTEEDIPESMNREIVMLDGKIASFSNRLL